MGRGRSDWWGVRNRTIADDPGLLGCEVRWGTSGVNEEAILVEGKAGVPLSNTVVFRVPHEGESNTSGKIGLLIKEVLLVGGGFTISCSAATYNERMINIRSETASTRDGMLTTGKETGSGAIVFITAAIDASKLLTRNNQGTTFIGNVVMLALEVVLLECVLQRNHSSSNIPW